MSATLIAPEKYVARRGKHICIQESASNAADESAKSSKDCQLTIPPAPIPNRRRPKKPVGPSRASSHIVRQSYQSDSQLLFERRVSFDSMPDELPCYAHAFSLKHVSVGYSASTKRRLFMVAVDLDKGPMDAIKYAVEELIEDGDELVIVGIHSPYCQPRETAQLLMDWVIDVHRHESKISITVELSSNSPKMTITDLVDMYEPSILVIGFRKKGSRKLGHNRARGLGIFKNSVQNVGVPVIYVKEKFKRNVKGKTEPFECQSLIEAVRQLSHQTTEERVTSEPSPPNQQDKVTQKEKVENRIENRHQSFGNGFKRLLKSLFTK